MGGWARRKGLFKLKGGKNPYAQKSAFLCKKIRKLICNFFKRVLVDRRLSEHLNHHECDNIRTYTRGKCLFMMSNPERCTDLFVVMLKFEGGWVGQNQFERCSNLEIRTEKWTVPKNIPSGLRFSLMIS